MKQRMYVAAGFGLASVALGALAVPAQVAAVPPPASQSATTLAADAPSPGANGHAPASASVPLAILKGRQLLLAKDFLAARNLFTAYLQARPGQLAGELGLADAELGLHEYEAAELRYRAVVAAEPTAWSAHQNLVIVEAALGRWDEFDRERALLHAARARGAAGLSARDSDVIDVIHLRGADGAPQRWIVRDYFQPAGRMGEIYNFERFSPAGRVLAVVSLERADALDAMPRGDDVVAIGDAPGAAAGDHALALDWVAAGGHGVVQTYAAAPSYERLRADFLRWARRQ